MSDVTSPEPGSWEERSLAGNYLLKRSVHCTCCGRMLIGQVWVSGGRVFCEPECEHLYREYWLPRHGGVAP
jgi:hypothetical protein